MYIYLCRFLVQHVSRIASFFPSLDGPCDLSILSRSCASLGYPAILRKDCFVNTLTVERMYV